MHCINTLAKLETLRADAAAALIPITKKERAKIDADATASTQRAWDEYVASRKAAGVSAPVLAGADFRAANGQVPGQ